MDREIRRKGGFVCVKATGGTGRRTPEFQRFPGGTNTGENEGVNRPSRQHKQGDSPSKVSAILRRILRYGQGRVSARPYRTTRMLTRLSKEIVVPQRINWTAIITKRRYAFPTLQLSSLIRPSFQNFLLRRGRAAFATTPMHRPAQLVVNTKYFDEPLKELRRRGIGVAMESYKPPDDYLSTLAGDDDDDDYSYDGSDDTSVQNLRSGWRQ